MCHASVEVATLVGRNEYIADALRAAAEIVALAYTNHEGDRPSEDWLAAEVPMLRATLAHGGPMDKSTRELRRWRALEIVQLPRVLSTSSNKS